MIVTVTLFLDDYRKKCEKNNFFFIILHLPKDISDYILETQ